MSTFASSIYAGHVVHKRLAPKVHDFSYRVFALCLDVDEIGALDRELKVFSRNARNLFGFHDEDFASGGGVVGDSIRETLVASGLGGATARISLLCYPRILGYAFNPLSVYFCRDAQGNLKAIVYEVTNTFKERRSYLIPVAEGCGANGIVAQRCAKQLYVSPFTAPTGDYGFHVRPPDDEVVIGVDYREGGRPTLKTHFRGARMALSDGALLRLLATYPLMTLKVIGGIHAEAARLWWKGVPVRERFTSPRFATTLVRTDPESPHV